jgi:hypothetical protein
MSLMAYKVSAMNIPLAECSISSVPLRVDSKSLYVKQFPPKAGDVVKEIARQVGYTLGRKVHLTDVMPRIVLVSKLDSLTSGCQIWRVSSGAFPVSIPDPDKLEVVISSTRVPLERNRLYVTDSPCQKGAKVATAIEPHKGILRLSMYMFLEGTLAHQLDSTPGDDPGSQRWAITLRVPADTAFENDLDPQRIYSQPY